ncbi:MAG: amidase family protein [Rhodospirillaceae bacterium]
MSQHHSISASTLARKIVRREITSEALCEDLCNRIEAHADLNAFATYDRAALLAQAKEADVAMSLGKNRGPLHGVPVLLKDNINTSAMATSGGTPALVGNIPNVNAPIAARLFEAGALLAGKANMHELSSGGTSANHVFGPVRNPFDKMLVPGGSSGGTAAAIAAGLAPAGLGTDTAGSVRVPAALCGVFGFRPSTGRYSDAGIVPLSRTQDTAGPLAAAMEDIILLDSLLAVGGAHPIRHKGTNLRIGVAEHLIETASSQISRTIDDTLQRLAKAGVTLVPVDLSAHTDVRRAATVGVIDSEFPGVMQAYLTAHAPHLTLESLTAQIASPSVKAFTEDRLRKVHDQAAYAYAIGDGLKAYQAVWASLFTDHTLDAIAFPTTPEVALPLAEDDNVMRNGESVLSWFYFSNTGPGSAGQRPGISLPVGLSKPGPDQSGLPVGLELDGLPGEDEHLLGVAQTVSNILDI